MLTGNTDATMQVEARRLESEAVLAPETWLVNNFAEACECLSICIQSIESRIHVVRNRFDLYTAFSHIAVTIFKRTSAIEKAELARAKGLSKRQIWYQIRVVPFSKPGKGSCISAPA